MSSTSSFTNQRRHPRGGDTTPSATNGNGLNFLNNPLACLDADGGPQSPVRVLGGGRTQGGRTPRRVGGSPQGWDAAVTPAGPGLPND